MASPIPNDFAAAAKSQLESQQAAWAALTTNALENVRKLVELNMKVMRESMGESAATTRQLLSAKTPQEFLSLSAAQTKPNIEKVLEYGRKVASIASSIQSELGKAVQTQIQETAQRAEPVVKQITKTAAPVDSENVYNIMKTALEKTNLGYDQWLKMTKQAAETIESKIADATNGFALIAKKAAPGIDAAKAAAKVAASPARKAASPAKKAASPARKPAARKKAAK